MSEVPRVRFRFRVRVMVRFSRVDPRTTDYEPPQFSTDAPVGSSGESSVGGLGTNPVGGMEDEVPPPQKLTTFLGLKVYFYAKCVINNFIFLTKFDSSFSHFGLHTLSCLESTFWLNSTLKSYCAMPMADLEFGCPRSNRTIV